MDQVVSRRSLTAEAQVRSQVSPSKICGEKSGTGLSLEFSFISTIPCSFPSTCWSCQKDEHSEPGNLLKSKVLWEIGSGGWKSNFTFIFVNIHTSSSKASCFCQIERSRCSDSLWAGRFGDRILVGGEIFHTKRAWAHPASCAIGAGSFPGGNAAGACR
jgi:hypothetical protein